jgi:hypothetical protein
MHCDGIGGLLADCEDPALADLRAQLAVAEARVRKLESQGPSAERVEQAIRDACEYTDLRTAVKAAEQRATLAESRLADAVRQVAELEGRGAPHWTHYKARLEAAESRLSLAVAMLEECIGDIDSDEGLYEWGLYAYRDPPPEQEVWTGKAQELIDRARALLEELKEKQCLSG